MFDTKPEDTKPEDTKPEDTKPEFLQGEGKVVAFLYVTRVP
jgi:hypothetical protein